MAEDFELARARRLHERSEAAQWEMAQLTYEITVERREATLAQWAQDTGMSLERAQSFLKVWETFGDRYLAGELAGRSFLEWAELVDGSEDDG